LVASANSPGVLLASTASLLLGSAKIRDHIDDGDGSVLTRRPMTKVSSRWADRARTQAALIGLDVEPLVAAIDSQTRLERRAIVSRTGGAEPRGNGLSGQATLLEFENDTRRASLDDPIAASRSDGGEFGRYPQAGSDDLGAVSLDDLTSPTQICAAELFAHTAVSADRPENVEALREAGRHFGRIAHLADAVEDFDDDRTRGRFNPLAVTGTTMPEAYDILRQSDSQLRKAVSEARLGELPTVRWILLDPLTSLLRRLGRGVGALPHACRTTPAANELQANGFGTNQRPPTRRPGVGKALALVLGVYCTGYACCADHTSPCSGQRKEAWIKDCDCGDCCDGCDCCDCGSCCDCGCDC
jgi:hypothetical protein